jgi:hypothetical protein
MKEKLFKVESEQISSCLSSAVTLSSGEVMLTGGQGQARAVYLLGGPQLDVWSKLADMNYGRYAHSSTRLIIDKEESVMVAGGWNIKGRVQDTVEVYSLRQQFWREQQHLPSPRVLFTLQVCVFTISVYTKSFTSQVPLILVVL